MSASLTGADRIQLAREQATEREHRGQQCFEFLRVLHQPSDVVEVRALSVGSKDHRKDSGYFDDAMKAAKAVIALDEEATPRGIYVTLNAVNTALLARSKNRLTEWARTMSGDADVVTRRWLFVDLDPERPSGISATSSEKQAAIERTEAVREWLMSEFGFGEPVECDSGNGRYLLWPIDLPNDDNSTALVRDVLMTISEHCGTTAVKIDTTVSNASRILRLPGTLNRKGDSTEDRPHRVASLVSVPDYLRPEYVEKHGREVVSRETLEAVARLVRSNHNKTAQTSAARPSAAHLASSRTDIIERARRYLAKIPAAVSGQGGHSSALLVAEHTVRGFELNDDEALDALSEWNQRCEPPWSEHELTHKIQEARTKGTAVEWGLHLRDTRTPNVTVTHPRVAAGAQVRVADNNELGTVRADRGDSCIVEFLQSDDTTRERELPKTALMNDDGSPLAETGFSLKLMRSDEFSKANFRRHFLIKGLLVEGQHGVVGGPQKSLKTGLMLDMAVSLGTGTPFLSDSRFVCPERVRTCLLSGESGGFTLKETALRICDARNTYLPTADILWGFDLPQLANPKHLEVMAKTFKDEGINVVMIDPAYLCLLSGDSQGRNPANVFAMGSLLKEVGQMGQEAGCTLLIAHHTRKAGRDDRFGITTLEDLSMSGFPEWARQWLLIGRRAEFKDGVHQLSLNVGGSAGHSGLYFVTVNEGIANDDDSRRKWDVRVETANEGIARATSAKETAKANARLSKLERLNEVIAQQPDGETKSVLKDLARLKTAEFDDLIEDLIERKAVEPCQLKKGNKTYGGFRRRKLDESPSTISTSDLGQLGTSRDSESVPTREGGCREGVGTRSLL